MMLHVAVLPNPQKTEMLWTKTPEVWVTIKNEFEKFVDLQKEKRDGQSKSPPLSNRESAREH